MAKKKIRERTTLNTIVLGVTAAFCTALVSLTVALAIPYTVIGHFYGMYTAGPVLPQNSELFQEWQGLLATQEALFFPPLSLLACGLTIGLLAPSKFDMTGRVVLAAKTALSLSLISFAFVWITNLITIRFKVTADTLPFHVLLVQIACFIGWTVVGALGGAGGAWVRTLRKGAKSSTQGGGKLPTNQPATR